MMHKQEYYRLWRSVPGAPAPPDLCEEVIKKSGILNQAPAPGKLNKPVYILANLAMVLVIMLLIGFDLQEPHPHSQERFSTNVIELAQKASLRLQPILMEKERKDIQ